ncbi:MAG: Swt1 family HEPN domain-containing protein, partial [Microcoleus sp.]
MSAVLKFELLALDTLEQSVIQSEPNLLYSLLSIGSLWKNPSIESLKIVDADVTLEARRVNADAESSTDINKDINKAFFITVESSYEWLEPKRKIIVEFLKKQSFDYLYVLTDEVSETIAHQLYPLIYRVENILRAYIVKFMTTRVGPKWWEITATSDLNQKVKNRKNNEKEFSKHIDNNAYLIDFGDLGKLIYAHSSGFTNKEDIIRKISDLEETPEAIQRLKEELKSNYQRFFKESFKDKNFQEKWEELEKIRHKVAHNNLFTNTDLERGRQLASELLEITNNAINSVDRVTLRSEEREAIRESFASQENFKEISEVELLKELLEQEVNFSKRNNGFVSLSNFVKVHLANKGYDISYAYKLIEELGAQSKVEV